MADYKMMYNLLFNEITDVIKQLKSIQQRTEEIYINSDNFSVDLFSKLKEKNKKGS